MCMILYQSQLIVLTAFYMQLLQSLLQTKGPVTLSQCDWALSPHKSHNGQCDYNNPLAINILYQPCCEMLHKYQQLTLDVANCQVIIYRHYCFELGLKCGMAHITFHGSEVLIADKWLKCLFPWNVLWCRKCGVCVVSRQQEMYI